MAKSSFQKRSVKPSSNDEDFKKRQLFMHNLKEK